MKRLTIGLLAHVDAGKTTLSEAMLYQAGAVRRLGRVDHKDAFLDTDWQERERGITIFSKQARLTWKDCGITLLDTPGHVDFSAETERAVQVLDCAVLLVSGADGVQGHTETLWRLLARHGVPTFVFVNKMDQPDTGRDRLLSQLRERLDEGCADFSGDWGEVLEQAALCDEGLMERYLETGELDDGDLSALIVGRKLFPCWFGAALNLDGVDGLLDGLARFALEPDWPEAFAARVFKISRDSRGERLTWLKVTGGTLKVRDTVKGPDWEEKAAQLRLYSGAKFTPAEEATAGTVCAVTGLTRTRAGQGLGAEEDWAGPELEPVLAYQVLPPAGGNAHTLLAQLRVLEEEDPQLRVEWNEELGEIRVHLMGEVQLEVLSRLLERRFGGSVAFGPGRIVYLETIAAPAEGVGHFEPLRHYAEVHLLLEPLERGAGLELDTACDQNVLDGHWQRLILTHLMEKEHKGVLTGAPVTDLRITLLTGRAHLKHTEGGDFRQATYRAVRQGLMSAKSVLLEPWYSFRLEVPTGNVGRAMTDLQRMGAEFQTPEQRGDLSVLTGSVPVSGAGGYWRSVAAYTGGRALGGIGDGGDGGLLDGPVLRAAVHDGAAAPGIAPVVVAVELPQRLVDGKALLGEGGAHIAGDGGHAGAGAAGQQIHRGGGEQAQLGARRHGQALAIFRPVVEEHKALRARLAGVGLLGGLKLFGVGDVPGVVGRVNAMIRPAAAEIRFAEDVPEHQVEPGGGHHGQHDGKRQKNGQQGRDNGGKRLRAQLFLVAFFFCHREPS